MRIVDLREIVVPIKSEIRNAYVNFSEMTVSVVALITDVIREGKPVVGFGFNSNGRYAPSGLLWDRFIPRLMSADPGVTRRSEWRKPRPIPSVGCVDD